MGQRDKRKMKELVLNLLPQITNFEEMSDVFTERTEGIS